MTSPSNNLDQNDHQLSLPASPPPAPITHAPSGTLSDTTFNQIVRREIDLVLAIRPRDEGSIMLVSNHERRGLTRVLQELIDNGQFPMARIVHLLELFDQRTSERRLFDWTPEHSVCLSADVLRRYSSAVNTIACFGMPSLTTAANMAVWLPGWKQMLLPGGVLVVELVKDKKDSSWCDTARRYAEMASPLGLTLHKVNGCEVEWGSLQESSPTAFQKRQLAIQYESLAERMGVQGRRQGMCSELANHARNLEGMTTVAELVNHAQNLKDTTEANKDSDGLYGLFVRRHAERWSEFP